MQEQELIPLQGTVEAITFRSEESGFTVMDFVHSGELITVVGALPSVNPGESLKLQGFWDYHPNFGRQFRAQLCEREMPKSAADMQKYLASGAIKGIGVVMATKIVEAFGAESFEVLEHDPKRLAQIKGISPAKAESISKAFQKQFAVREVIIALEKFGMTPSESIKAFRVLGMNAIDTVRRNPYILCEEHVGIGFTRADEISAKLPDSPAATLRTQAGILHLLRHNLYNSGHTCLPREKLLPLCAGFLANSQDEVDIAIDTLLETRRLARDNIGEREFLFLPLVYAAEKRASERLIQFLNFPPAGAETALQDLEKIEKQNGIAYGDKQREAILTAVRRGMLILTGGPGTGKTTTLNAILKLFEMHDLDVSLAAPTGRAAKRMSEITGKEAKTIHRLLEVEWDQNESQHFARNMENPLECDVLILDELSMVDIQLFSSLLDAIPPGCRFIMVGDSDQLPPVGPGNVLRDLIRSGLMPVVELKEVFRQAMESLIVTNAHKIVNGEQPVLDSRDRDFFFLPKGSAAQTAQLVCDLNVRRLPEAYGYSPLSDIQVICPSRKGDAGTYNLNRCLQQVLNPPDKGKHELPSAGRIFREGDKVMQIKNNYDLEWSSAEKDGAGIFNGDIGIIKRISGDGNTLDIHFDDKRTHYPAENLQELEHAYAITVHKSQGNEFEAVILPICRVAPQLAYRNLLYTAVTRAKKLLIAVGSGTELQSMAENSRQAKRYSALKTFLIREKGQTL